MIFSQVSKSAIDCEQQAQWYQLSSIPIVSTVQVQGYCKTNGTRYWHLRSYMTVFVGIKFVTIGQVDEAGQR